MRKSLGGTLECLLCKERADHWHHVLTSNEKLMINAALCMRCHNEVHRLNPRFTDKFLKKLKLCVGRLKTVVGVR